MPAWLELKLALGRLDPERVEEALEDAGALSVTYEDAGDQPLYEPAPDSIWANARLCALFPADVDTNVVRGQLLASLSLTRLPAHRFEPLEDRDWAREWLKDFKPMRFGKRLWICPTAYAPPDPQAVNILLDPGLAFGTGSHATTALCLEWLDGAAVAGKDLVDYGCGSGILAIAAARLGAKRVFAVDNDPQALTATRENATRNGVEGTLRLYAPEALPTQRFQLLLANILARPLTELAPRFGELLETGGQLVLSGILEQQEEDIRRAYGPGFEFQESAGRDGWLRLVFVRK